jgi:hypothetical protein
MSPAEVGPFVAKVVSCTVPVKYLQYQYVKEKVNLELLWSIR